MTVKRPKHRVMTRMGLEVDLQAPKTDAINIMDIAHALSMQCRYNGMTSIFYSVAEHCVMVAKLVKDAGGTEHDQLCALMHDAHEAYIGDMIQPMKTMGFEMFDTIEAIFDAVIALRFGLTPDDRTRERIHNADMDAAATEMRDLTRYEKEVWQGVGRAQEEIIANSMSPWEAREAFLARFKELGGKE